MMRRENIPVYAVILWIGLSITFRNNREVLLAVHAGFFSVVALWLLWILVESLREAWRDPVTRFPNLRAAALVGFLLLTALMVLYFPVARPAPKERARGIAKTFAVAWVAGLAATIAARRQFARREHARLEAWKAERAAKS